MSEHQQNQFSTLPASAGYNIGMEMFKIRKAGQLLRDLESNVNLSALNEDWKNVRPDFIYAVNQVTDLSGINTLLSQLRTLEGHLVSSNQSDDWLCWKHKYWLFMTDPKLEIPNTVTRLVITLKFLEENILPKACYSKWNETKRGRWLIDCNNLLDPLHQLAFYDGLFLRVEVLLEHFGYSSFHEYDCRAREVISHIDYAAQKLDQVAMGTGIADTTAGSLGVATGVVGGLGLILAPFTRGISMILTATSLGLGLGSVVTSVSSSIIQNMYDKSKLQEVQQETEKITAETMALIQLLENYATSADELKNKLDLLEDSQASTYLIEAGLGSYGLIKGSIDVARMVKIVGRIRPDLMAHGLKTKLVLDAATRTVFKNTGSFSLTAAKLSGFLSVLTIGFGIWGTMVGANKIMEGSALAKQFRELADTLASSKSKILSAYDTKVKM